MNPQRWEMFTRALHNPPSLTSTDDGRIAEAREYIAKIMPSVLPEEELLIIGCGDGLELEIFEELAGRHALGVTNNVDELSDNEDMVCTDVHDMPFDAWTFDVIVSKEALEHFLSPFIALWEMNRVCKMGAKFVHYIPTGPYKQRDWYHLNCFPDYLWVDLFRKTGWEVQKISHDLQQIRYEGVKVADFHQDFQIELYDLETLTASLYENSVPVQPVSEAGE